MPPATDPAGVGTITAVIVNYDSEPQDISATVEGLLVQTRAPGEVLVVDNGVGGAQLGERLQAYAPAVRVLAPGSNLGYAGGVNFAAVQATGDYLLCLNPDAQAERDCLAALAAVADSDSKVALVGAQVLLADGVTRNAGANPLHPTGISPSGGYGQPREYGPPREVAVVSGACCLIRRSAFEALCGLVHELFMYYDDVDLAWRARIAGLRVVYCPEAVVTHGYEFARRPEKWFHLERNRLFSVLSNYEALTLAALAPLLLATELGLIVLAAHGGWLKHKLRSYASLFALRERLALQRRQVEASRRRNDAAVMALFEDRLDSALLPARAVTAANLICLPYLWLVRRLVRLRDGSKVGDVLA